MSQQAALFSRAHMQPFQDALSRHQIRYGSDANDREKFDAAARKKLHAKERRDALCQGFFEAMLRPPQRHVS